VPELRALPPSHTRGQRVTERRELRDAGEDVVERR
jgi:hypothetical protein